jgi:NitT/TauT family transport system permease protein
VSLSRPYYSLASHRRRSGIHRDLGSGGAKIGLSPRLSRYAQPVVQVLASFPAILLFPFAIVIFLALNLSLDYGAIFLMALGSQWYILFNVIAGASAIPTELREMADQFRFPWMQR